MADLTDSLSSYVSPSYGIDYFPTRRKGKSTSSYIYASVYNKLASSIIASQERVVLNASLTGSVDTGIYANFHSVTKSPLTRRTGGSPMSWQTYLSPTGQNGISEALIGATQYSGSALKTTFFYGQGNIDSSGYDYYIIGWRDLKTKLGVPGGSIYVGNYIDRSVTGNIIDPNTFQNLSLSLESSSLPFSSSVLKSTPYHSIILKNATNADSSPSGTIDNGVDRYPTWDTTVETGFESNYSTVRQRVIIGSSRGFNLGAQYLSNRKVYNAETVTGTTTLPAGHSSDNKTIMGPGALMMNGTLFVPYAEDIEVPSSYSSAGLTKTAASNAFFCYPGLNSPKRHGTFAGANNALLAHVFVIGDAV